METQLLDLALVTGVVCLLLWVREMIMNFSRMFIRNRSARVISPGRNASVAGHQITKV